VRHHGAWFGGIALAVAAIPGLAETSDPVFTLPLPLSVDPNGGYELPTGSQGPEPRRGLALHGYRYDRLSGPEWATPALAKSATACGDRLQVPSLQQIGQPAEDAVTEDFWLIVSEPEALYLSRRITLTGLTDCVAQGTASLTLTRLLFAGDMVTQFRFDGERLASLSTVPANDGFSYAGSPFLQTRDPGKLRPTQNRIASPRPGMPLRLRVTQACTADNGGMIYTTECRVSGRGQWRGLLLQRHVFHTATHHEGLVVDFLEIDTLVDGRLFEWDRRIGLTKPDVEVSSHSLAEVAE
jgi:hypothetical protein